MELQEEQVWEWYRDQEFKLEHVQILGDSQVKTLNRRLDIEVSRKLRTREIRPGIGNGWTV